jgi:hypothetical protein
MQFALLLNAYQFPQFMPVSIWLNRSLLIALVVALVVLISLTVSGRVTDFAKAFEYCISRMARVLAIRLYRLQRQLKAFTSDSAKAAKFFGAILCLLVAVGVAIANYAILEFSFQLFLPAGEALTAIAACYVLLKAVAGILIHFLEKGWARSIVIATILAASLCATSLAYMRALALSEANDIESVTTPIENPVKVNPNLLSEQDQESPPIEQEVKASDSSDSGWFGPDSREALLVAAVSLIIDTFELLCVFGALKLSTAGVVSLVIFPAIFPLTIVKEAFWLINRTRITSVISIPIQAFVESPRIIVVSTASALRRFSAFAIRELKLAGPEVAKQLRAALIHWRKRHIFRLKRDAALDRIALREANRRAKLESENNCADDERTSTRRNLQAGNEFLEEELAADLEHRAHINQALRAKATAVLTQNLDRVEMLFDEYSQVVVQEALQKSHEAGALAAGDVAEKITQTITEQYVQMTEPPVIPARHHSDFRFDEPRFQRKNGGPPKTTTSRVENVSANSTR